MQLFESEWILIDDTIYRINSARDLDTARSKFLEAAMTLIPCDSATFWLSDKSSPGKLCDPILNNFSQEHAQKYLELYMDTDYAKWLFSSSQSRAYRSSDWFPPGVFEETAFYKNYYKECNIHYAALLTLSYNDEFNGIVFLYRSRQHKDFTEKDLFILDIFKKHLSLMIHNSRDVDMDMHSASALTFGQEHIRNICSAYNLTPREHEIISLLLKGMPNTEIADTLMISGSTLRTHSANIYRKLNINRRSELIKVFSDTERFNNTE